MLKIAALGGLKSAFARATLFAAACTAISACTLNSMKMPTPGGQASNGALGDHELKILLNEVILRPVVAPDMIVSHPAEEFFLRGGRYEYWQRGRSTSGHFSIGKDQVCISGTSRSGCFSVFWMSGKLSRVFWNGEREFVEIVKIGHHSQEE